MTSIVSSRSSRIGLLTCIVGLGVTGALFAQNQPVRPTQPGQPVRQQPGQPGVRAGENLDPYFAACVILSNQNEVAVARLAEQRSKSPEVKRYAEKLQADHEKFIGELEKFASAHSFRDRLAAGKNKADGDDKAGPAAAQQRQPQAQRQPAQVQPGEPAQRRMVANESTADQFLQIKHEIADECLASARRELSDKEGREFDACFIGMQLGAHMYMVDELKVLERHAGSPELKQTLSKGRETAQAHLDRAKEIMKDIDKGETRSTAKAD